MIIYTHPACLLHDPGPDHPESPARLRAVLEALRKAHGDLDWRDAPAARLGDLHRVHSPDHVEAALASGFDGYRHIDPDTVISPGSRAAAVHAAGAGIAAVDALMDEEDCTVFCAVRPPGHHATAQAAMGFCLLNNVAIAAAHAVERYGLGRVGIVDFDVHHGNGTQDIFRNDPRVCYLSTHEAGLFPYGGGTHERGVGNIRNVPLPSGTDSLRFQNTWADDLLPWLDDFRPELLLVSAGFDGHLRDPMADMMLQTEDFAWLTRELRAIARRHADGKLVSMLEGGYDIEALAECCVAHVAGLR